MLNKKSQMGETLTWVVATLIIIAILIISIFFVSGGASISKTLGLNKEVEYYKIDDELASKSLFAYLLTKDNSGTIIYEQLKNEGGLNSFNGNLAARIFKGFYEKDYHLTVWLGFLDPFPSPGARNEYFGWPPIFKRNIDPHDAPYVNYVFEQVYLTDKKILNLVLMDK